jgi:type II secretory pathway pseudopilin PulG
LAEVLITLGIIGVVAAMTIPTLMKNIQDNEFKIAFKKDYSDISQAAALLRSDNGGTLNGVFTDGDTLNGMEIFKPYFRNIKMQNYIIYMPNGAYFWTIGSGWCRSSCTDETASNSKTCFGVLIDVNGDKLPNVNGRDRFYIRLLATRTVPVGIPGDYYASDCGKGTGNVGCAGWVMQGKDY